MVKKILPFLGLVILLLVVASALPAGKNTPRATAADNELTGFAWSSNIGWISLNCSNTGSCTKGYKVIKRSDGQLSGYGWSSNIGWVNFAPASRNYPVGRGTFPGAARFDGNNIKGWIQALSAGGGWDGWISMGGQTTNGGKYGPIYNETTKKFSGFAWGGDVVGWVDFQYAECPSCGGIIQPETAGLNVAVSGSGAGGVVSDDDKIRCGTAGTDCSEDYATAKRVVLTASASSGSDFAGWSGNCVNDTRVAANICQVDVVLGVEKTVTATFNNDSDTCDPATEDCGGGGGCDPKTQDCDGNGCTPDGSRDCICEVNPDAEICNEIGPTEPLFNLSCFPNGNPGSDCNVDFNCDAVSDCDTKALYSEQYARITANYNYDLVNYDVLKTGLGGVGLFEVRYCQTSNSLLNCLSEMPNLAAGGQTYLRFFKPAGSDPVTDVYYINFKATAEGDSSIETIKRINLNFTNSAGTQR